MPRGIRLLLNSVNREGLMSCCRGREGDLLTRGIGGENCLEFHNDIRARRMPAENIPMITTL